MKSKQSLFLIAILILCLQTSCSQILRDQSLYIKYVQLPQVKLPDSYMTFSVESFGQSLMKARTNPDQFSSRFVMDGFKKLSGIGDNAGHLRVAINSGFIENNQPEFKSITRKSKDKQGVETSTTYYYFEFLFSNYSSFKIFNPEGEVLFSGNVPNQQTYKSTEITSSSVVKKERNSYFNEFETKFAESVASNLYNSVNTALKINFDFVNERDRQELFVIKKHSSEDQFYKHYNLVKSIFDAADYTTPSSELLRSLENSIAFYESYANKDPRGDKKKKRLYQAGNYNLALIYYYTDQFDKSREYCNRVLASEGKDGKSKRLLFSIEKQAELMDINGIHTMHYFRDLEKAIAPSQLAKLEAQKDEISDETRTTVGTVYKGNVPIVGTLSLDKDADDMVFCSGGNVKFFVEENSVLKEIDLCSPEVTEFVIADRKFKKRRFSPSAKGKQEASLQILEEVYSSERIKLYKYYSSAGALSDEKPEFAFQKNAEEYPISLESTQYLIWNKGIAKYFEDCADLKLMCENGEIGKNKEDLIKAARIYSELCATSIKP